MPQKPNHQSFFPYNRITVSDLQKEWEILTRKFCSNAQQRAEIFALLRDKYTETPRFYHNLSHVNSLLRQAADFVFDDAEAVQMAIWFHDVIYNPLSGNNETDSAELAVICLQDLDFPPDKIKRIRQMILATQKHSPADLDEDGRIFLDLDLSILGSGEEIYDKYRQAIRREYSFVPYFLYRRSRRRILQNFLARETIYYTEKARQRWENQAQTNLNNEINLLR
jgi:predicted metal-dependent HD superfamily phosphohydrolase